MENRTIRTLIWLFLALIAVFVFFIVINAVWNRGGQAAPRVSASAMARSMLTMAEFGPAQAAGRGGPPPPGTSTGPVSSGGMMVVRNRAFEGVAEPPETTMDLLSGMAGGGKSKIQPIPLSQGDMERKITILSSAPAGTVALSPVPGLGQPGPATNALVSAPVDYKLFSSAETWAAFADSHKCDALKPDFSRESVLILVSLSDLPSGIFKVAGVETGKTETVVRYRVDPLAMSASSPEGGQQAYSAAVVHNSALPVRLEQVP